MKHTCRALECWCARSYIAVLTNLFISNLHPKVLQNCILVQIRVMVYLWENVLVGIEVMRSFLELVMGGIKVMLLIRATGYQFESLE